MHRHPTSGRTSALRCLVWRRGSSAKHSTMTVVAVPTTVLMYTPATYVQQLTYAASCIASPPCPLSPSPNNERPPFRHRPIVTHVLTKHEQHQHTHMLDIRTLPSTAPLLLIRPLLRADPHSSHVHTALPYTASTRIYRPRPSPPTPSSPYLICPSLRGGPIHSHPQVLRYHPV